MELPKEALFSSISFAFSGLFLPSSSPSSFSVPKKENVTFGGEGAGTALPDSEVEASGALADSSSVMTSSPFLPSSSATSSSSSFSGDPGITSSTESGGSFPEIEVSFWEIGPSFAYAEASVSGVGASFPDLGNGGVGASSRIMPENKGSSLEIEPPIPGLVTSCAENDCVFPENETSSSDDRTSASSTSSSPFSSFLFSGSMALSGTPAGAAGNLEMPATTSAAVGSFFGTWNLQTE